MWVRDAEGVETGAIAELVDLRGKRVLDVGCGTGRLTEFIAPRAEKVFAFDPDAERIPEARGRLSPAVRRRVTFRVCGAEELEVRGRRFDVALCGWSLWCVPLESVVNALRRIHTALVPGGLVLDMQPVGPRPPVEANGLRLGSLDMREWRRTIDDVAALVDEAIADGLFAEDGERRYDVLETFDDGKELVETVRDWTGTKISRALATRVERATPPLAIRENVRLRVLRAL